MDVRNRLAIALDVPDLDRAEHLAKEVAPWFGVAKVGLELYSAAGPEAIARMRSLDLDVFADIKLHDIPTTVGRAARVLGRQGVRYLNFHAAGFYPENAAGYAYDVDIGWESVYGPMPLEKCPKDGCDPKLRPKRPVEICE